jgi:hypothetical protein
MSKDSAIKGVGIPFAINLDLIFSSGPEGADLRRS